MDNSHRALSNQGDHKGDHKLLLWPDPHPRTKTNEVSTSAQTNQGTKEKSVLTRRPAWYPNKKNWTSKEAVLLNSDPSPNLQTQKLLIRKPPGYTSEQAASAIQHPFPGVVTYCYKKKCCPYDSDSSESWRHNIEFILQQNKKKTQGLAGSNGAPGHSYTGPACELEHALLTSSIMAGQGPLFRNPPETRD